MTRIGGVEITGDVRMAMLQAALAVKRQIGRELTAEELDALILETVRQIKAKAKARLH